MTPPASPFRTIVIVAAALVTLLPQPSMSRAQEPMDAPLLGSAPDGLDVTPLAGKLLDPDFGLAGSVTGQFTRLPLDPGERIASGDAESGGFQDHLLFAESGPVTVSTSDGEQALQTGEQAFVTAYGPFAIHNPGSGCASILLLSATGFGQGAGLISTAPEETPNLPVSCGEPTPPRRFGGPLATDAPPLLLFMAELTLLDGYVARGFLTHPGHVGLLVASGTLFFSMETSPITSYLRDGSWVRIPAGQPYGIANDADDAQEGRAARALLMGIVPAGQEVFGLHDGTSQPTLLPTESTEPSATGGTGIDGATYTSPDFGASVSWNPTVWTASDTSTTDWDEVRLDAATGSLWMTASVAHGGDARACLNSEQARYSEVEGVSAWALTTDANGNTLTGETANSAWAAYANIYTDPANPSAPAVDYVDYIECVSLGDGRSVVVFYTYAEREDIDAHLDAVRAVIDSLMLPDGG